MSDCNCGKGKTEVNIGGGCGCGLFLAGLAFLLWVINNWHS